MDDASPGDRGLASERTTLAWQRSGLSLIVVAGLVARAGIEADAPILAVVAGGIVALVGVGVWMHGQRTYRQYHGGFAAGRVAPHVHAMRVTAATTTLVAGLAFALVVALA